MRPSLLQVLLLVVLIEFQSSLSTRPMMPTKRLGKYHGHDWQMKSAAQKEQLLWAAVSQNKTSQDWPSTLEQAELFAEGMSETFDTVADDMPYSGAFDILPREKLIHSVGCLSQINLVITNNTPGYTGLFSSGSTYAFIRFSTAKEYDSTAQSFTPGVSFKFLRNGVPSANFMAMYSLEGQPSFNFFKHDLTNHVPNLSLNASYALQAIKLKFSLESDFANMLGLSDFATYDQSGNQASNPNFPFRLIFQPSLKLKSFFPDSYTTSDLCSQLATLSAPQPIYHVWAESQPMDDPILIGYVAITTSPIPSLFGDQTLFFEHQRMEDDLAIFPDWTDAANTINNKEGDLPYFNGPADLPDNW